MRMSADLLAKDLKPFPHQMSASLYKDRTDDGENLVCKTSSWWIVCWTAWCWSRTRSQLAKVRLVGTELTSWRNKDHLTGTSQPGGLTKTRSFWAPSKRTPLTRQPEKPSWCCAGDSPFRDKGESCWSVMHWREEGERRERRGEGVGIVKLFCQSLENQPHSERSGSVGSRARVGACLE